MSVSRRSLLFAALRSAPLVGALAGAAGARAEGVVTVAAASDLRFALDELVQIYRATGSRERVQPVYGASGKLATQIRHGAPFDLFMSADVAFARALHAEGHAVTKPKLFALGRLALWSTDARLAGLTLDDVARHPALQRFAIANPIHAPYGQRAVEALRHRGLFEALEKRLVLGENVAQAAHFIDSGAAQAGLVAHSLVLAQGYAGRGSWSLLPQAWHSPLEQAFVITRHGSASAGTRAFAQFLESAPARQVLRRNGLSLPGETASS